MGVREFLFLWGVGLTNSEQSVSSCAHWCHIDVHCSDTACGACAMCSKGGKMPCAPAGKSDIPFMACQGWCNTAHSHSHCTQCSCKACAMCAAGAGVSRSTPEPGPLSVLQAQPRTGLPCTATSAGDSSEMRCEHFCQRQPPGSGSCAFCRCQACPQCLPPHPPAPPAPPPQPKPPLPAPPPTSFHLGAKCTPFSAGDVSERECEPFCERPNASPLHCKFCRCQGCHSCVNTQPSPPPPPPPFNFHHHSPDVLAPPPLPSAQTLTEPDHVQPSKPKPTPAQKHTTSKALAASPPLPTPPPFRPKLLSAATHRTGHSPHGSRGEISLSGGSSGAQTVLQQAPLSASGTPQPLAHDSSPTSRTALGVTARAPADQGHQHTSMHTADQQQSATSSRIGMGHGTLTPTYRAGAVEMVPLVNAAAAESSAARKAASVTRRSVEAPSSSSLYSLLWVGCALLFLVGLVIELCRWLARSMAFSAARHDVGLRVDRCWRMVRGRPRLRIVKRHQYSKVAAASCECDRA